MGNRIYQNDRMGYGIAKRGLHVKNEAYWFYKRLGIEIGKNPKEVKLKQYMDGLREQMKKDMVEGKAIYPAAMPFYQTKAWIEEKNDTLFRIFQKMPKGGLLHVHSAAALSTDAYLELLKKWSIDTKKEPENFPAIVVVTKYEGGDGKYIEGMLLFDYQLKNAEGVETVKFMDIMEDEEKIADLKKKLCISEDATGQAVDIWTEFSRIFARIDNLYTNADFYLKYHIAFFAECSRDNIDYVEIRSGFQEFSPSGPANDGSDMGEKIWCYADRHEEYHVDRHLYFKELAARVEPENPDRRFLELLCEALKKAKKDGLVTGEFRFRVILNANRSLDPAKERDLEVLSKKVDAAISLKEKYGYQELIIGFDFVNEEDRGMPTSNYVDAVIYQPFGTGYVHQKEYEDTRYRIRHIDFFLHDGESCWKSNDNVTDAALISKHRIGHGFNMNLFSKTAEEITTYRAGEGGEPLIEPVLEICPISNQLLHYYRDIRNHSAYELMKNGICCVIANDDPLILGNAGLSYDYWEAYVGMELPLEAIKASVYITLLYRDFFYGSNAVFKYEDAMSMLNAKWNEFVNVITKELHI